MNRTAFFDAVRQAPFGGSLKQSQVAGITTILDAAPPEFPLDWVGYCLTTTYWESAKTMLPIEEYGKGKGREYGRPDPQTGQTYFGRGLVQLTWRANYAKAGQALGVDLVNHPELALKPDIAAKIMFRGMNDGWFTTKKLSDYFAPGRCDPVGARRIINGQDKAQEIAGFFVAFQKALKAAGYAPSSEAAAPPPVAANDPPPAQPAKSGGLFSGWWASLSSFGRKAS